MDKLMPFLSKFIAPVVVGLLAWLADKTGIVSLTSTEFTETVTALIVWTVTEVTHVLIAKKTNPSGANTTQLAVVDKQRNEEIKNGTSSSTKPIQAIH